MNDRGAGRRNVVRVRIVGEDYTIRSDATPDHTRAVADYVDEAIRQVMDSGSVVERHKAAILAALQITSELFAERAARDALDAGMTELCADVMRLLPPSKRTPDGVETTSAD